MRRHAVVSRVRGRTDWLLDEGLLSSEELANAVSVAEHSGQPLRQVLDRLGLVSQWAWASASARATGLKCIEASDFPEVLSSDPRLSSHYLRRHGLALLSLDGAAPRIAMADPTDMHVRQALSIVFGDAIYAPTGGETALVNEVHREPLSASGIYADQQAAYFRAQLGPTVGGFSISEHGLLAADDTLLAIGRRDPPVPKALVDEFNWEIVVQFSDLQNISVLVDETLGLPWATDDQARDPELAERSIDPKRLHLVLGEQA